MPPGTEHYALSLTHSVMRGAQFLNRYVIRQALPTLIHTTVHDDFQTNVMHTQTWAIYARFLICWCKRCLTGTLPHDILSVAKTAHSAEPDDLDPEHIPPPNQFSGLVDIVYLGLTILASTLFLGMEKHRSVFVECQIANKVFKEFVQWHRSHYCVDSTHNIFTDVPRIFYLNLWGYFALVRRDFEPSDSTDAMPERLQAVPLRKNMIDLWDQLFQSTFLLDAPIHLPSEPAEPEVLFPNLNGEVTLLDLEPRSRSPSPFTRPSSPLNNVVMLLPIDPLEAHTGERAILAHAAPKATPAGIGKGKAPQLPSTHTGHQYGDGISDIDRDASRALGRLNLGGEEAAFSTEGPRRTWRKRRRPDEAPSSSQKRQRQ